MQITSLGPVLAIIALVLVVVGFALGQLPALLAIILACLAVARLT